MIGKILLGVAALVVAGVVALVLTGSAFWYLIGASDDLSVDGKAQRIADAGPAPAGEGWPTWAGDSGGSRYSALTEINRDNVSGLKPAWTYRTRAFEGREDVIKRTAFEATPILADDKLLLCSPFNEVIALNPGTGEEIWRYDPEIDTGQRPANQFVCRGVSAWTDARATDATATDAACSRRVFMATNDARLIALDRDTGRPCADFGADGQVQLKPSLPLRWPGEYQVTSAPAVAGDVVVVGSSISDNLRAAAPSGVVQAFDARTGAALWSFDPIPRDAANPDRATWGGGSADVTGHANVWSTISVDAQRGWVFLPTSSPSPDFFGGLRPGDNRMANSIVALDARDGSVKWSFQTVHHDVWDYDVPAQPGLYSIWVNGARRDVVAQVTKTGFVFVLDRDTGQPVLPVEERATPQGGADGEMLSPTQPFPVKTPPLVPNTLAADEAFGLTGIDKAACADRIRSLRAEGLFTPPSEQGTLLRPFSGGGANWGGPAFDPMRNLLVVNVSNLADVITLIPADKVGQVEELMHDAEISPQEGAPFGMMRELLLSPIGLPCTPPPWGMLAAVDLGTGEIVWRRPVGGTRDLAPMGLNLSLGAPTLGGPLITAGDLVFLAATVDSGLRAFDVETGKMLWEDVLPASAQSGPASYEWQGRQYVVVAAGGYGNVDSRMGDYVVAYALAEAE